MVDHIHEQSLVDRWVLITGAAKRIGATIATKLHGEGANIAIHYFASSDAAEALAKKLNAERSNSAITVQGDLRNIANLERMAQEVINQTDGLYALINNASSFYPTPLGDITEEQWDDLIGSNLKAPLFLSQALLPHLRKTMGIIINIVDVHSQRPLRNHPIYGSAKAGLGMLTRSLAKDLGPEIRVNGISPGAILWPESGMPEKAQDNIIQQIPLKRAGTPEDIAAAALFLMRDAPYITGQILNVDGGRSIGW
ncbi:MAG: pteridine reductase [Gammaproteobacteria bacterium]|nr:pteridine reductase [Gammaproteobacteria bacterium]